MLSGARYCTKCGQKLHSHKNRKEKLQNSVDRAKRRLKSFYDNNKLVAIAKYSFITFVCLLAFIFSFTGIVKVEVTKAYENLFASLVSNVVVENADVDLYLVDIIKLMFASTRHYGGDSEFYESDFNEDADKIEALEKQYKRSYSRLIKEMSSIEVSNQGYSKLHFSNSAKIALHDTLVDYLEYNLSLENGDIPMEGGDIIPLCTAGTLLLLNIVISSLFLVISVVRLINVCKRVKKGDKVSIFRKFDYLLSLLIAFPVAALLALSPLGMYVTVAGTLITTLVFVSIAFIFSLINRFVAIVKESGTAKAIIPNIVLVVFCAIIIGCCFAPLIGVEVETNSYIVSTELYGNSFSDLILSEDEKNEIDDLLNVGYIFDGNYKGIIRYSALTPKVETYLNYLTSGYFSNISTLYANDSATLNEYTAGVVSYSCLIQLGLIGSPAMSVGYFALVIGVIFAFALLCSVCANKRSGKVAFSIVCLIMFLITLAIATTVTVAVNHQIDAMEFESFTLTLFGGIIATIVFTVLALIIGAIPFSKLMAKKEKDEFDSCENSSDIPFIDDCCTDDMKDNSEEDFNLDENPLE